MTRGHTTWHGHTADELRAAIDAALADGNRPLAAGFTVALASIDARADAPMQPLRDRLARHAARLSELDRVAA